MDARAALQIADVAQTLDLLKSNVRREPRNVGLRVFLFQLLCVTGEWDRALNQLAVVGELDVAAQPMVSTYQAVVRCEVLRSKIFAGERTPTVFGEPPAWVPFLIESLRLLASGCQEQAVAFRTTAFEAAPASPACVDKEHTDWVSDSDPRLGPIVEAIVEGRYLWIPYTRIRSLRIEPPADLRDQVWLPVHFTWENGGIADGFIPTRYPGTTAHTEPSLLLARRTEWVGEGDLAVPIGQRVLITDHSEVALMDLRHLDLHPPSSLPAA